MKPLNRVVVAVVGVVVLLFAIGFALPTTWHAEQTILIQSPPTAIYPWIASFKEGWITWSPFGIAADPGMHIAYDGPVSGVGATQRWTASKKGDGQMRIVAADPQQGVRYQLTMVNGFNISGHIALSPEGANTRVVWTDDGEFTNPVSRYLGLFMPRMLEPSLARGLASLKAQAEQHTFP
jgi:hypothetical protein